MYCPKTTLKVKTYILFIVCNISFLTLSAQTKNEVITSGYDKDKLKSLILSFENDYKLALNKTKQALRSATFIVKEKTTVGQLTELIDFGEDGTPLYYSTFNSAGSKVSRANTLHENGLLNLNLDGSGMQVGIWDGGIALSTHQEFDNRSINLETNQEEVSAHATMVTGTIISSGVKEKARGVANKVTALNYNWTRDKIEVAQEASNGLLLSNHSYGINSSRVPDWYFGSYIRVSQDWDKIMYNAPYYLMVTAAGNSQRKKDNEIPIYGKTEDGFDLMLGFTTSKNGLVIAGADVKINDLGNLKEASVSSYSSFGPIDDGRIKPDLAGDGTSIYSTYSSDNKSYNTLIGTSMSASTVTGSLLLLQDYHDELYGSYMKAATLKGLALHTADDVQEPGPDYKMGWGVINAKRAAEVLSHKEYSTIVSEETLENGQSFSITIKANSEEALMASISWTDPEGNYVNSGELNDTTPALVNDLDIKITKNSNVYFPWKMIASSANDDAIRGDNSLDPFERIDILDAEGTYTITVTHKGTLTQEKQDFSLIVSGVILSACELVAPSNIVLDSSDEQSVSWSWKGVEETLYEIQYKEKNRTNWKTNITLENTLSIDSLEINKDYQIRFRSFCTQNVASDFSQIYEFNFNGSETQFDENQERKLEEELEIQIFPNPAISTISILSETSNTATYIISTLSGVTIKKGKVQGPIDIAKLQSGLYIITVQDTNQFKSTKFFKN